jgi:hypothetical protein
MTPKDVLRLITKPSLLDEEYFNAILTIEDIFGP